MGDTNPPPVQTEGENTFLAHNLKSLHAAIVEQNRIVRDLIVVLGDLRDELARWREVVVPKLDAIASAR